MCSNIWALQRRAVNRNISLVGSGISGVTCMNCYVYIGAQLNAVVNYFNSGTTLNLEHRMAGKLGVNVDLQLSNPTVSGVQTFTLIPASRNWTTLITSGNDYLNPFLTPSCKSLVVKMKIGAFTATVSGTGSALVVSRLGRSML